MSESIRTSGDASSVDQARWFAEEVQPHVPSLRAYLRNQFPTITDLDDVVQEAHVRLIQASRAMPILSAKAYLFATARNVALAVFRRPRLFVDEAVTGVRAANVPAAGADVAETVCTREEFALLLEAIDHLPPRCREIFILRKLRHFSKREAAIHLGLSEETIHAQTVRAAGRCARFLEKRGVAPFRR